MTPVGGALFFYIFLGPTLVAKPRGHPRLTFAMACTQFGLVAQRLWKPKPSGRPWIEP